MSNSESILSNIPPCPGRRVPESLVLVPRFIIDSVRSPNTAVAPKTKPNIICSMGEIGKSNKVDNNNEAIIAAAIPATTPSQVLFGLMVFANLYLPMLVPTKYADVSTAKVSNNTYKSQSAPL